MDIPGYSRSCILGSAERRQGTKYYIITLASFPKVPRRIASENLKIDVSDYPTSPAEFQITLFWSTYKDLLQFLYLSRLLIKNLGDAALLPWHPWTFWVIWVLSILSMLTPNLHNYAHVHSLIILEMAPMRIRDPENLGVDTTFIILSHILSELRPKCLYLY